MNAKSPKTKAVNANGTKIDGLRTSKTRAVAPRTVEVIDFLDRYLEELESGGQPSAEGLTDLAEILRPYLNELDLLHEAADAGLGASGLGASLPADRANRNRSAPQPGCLGDFRLLREVGRGGMGIVYEAEQISLNRRVALKVLPFAATLDAKQLSRFRNEARAAAQLHHPHIVPVYGVGTDRGVHYYAMQLIEGCSLATVIDELRGASRPGKEPAGATTGMNVAGGGVAETRPVAAQDTKRSH